VHGLTTEDFTLLQDGRAQPIEAFTEIRLPERVEVKTAPWTSTVPADVATNEITEQEGRLVIILLDRSIPLGQPTIAARRIALEAIDQLGPNDLAAVASTSGGMTQTLTADRGRLRRAVEASDPSTGVSADSRELEEQLAGGGPFMTWTRLNDGRCLCGLCVMESVTRISDAVSVAARRRKVLLFIGSEMAIQAAGTAGGARTDVGCESRLRDAREAMFSSLSRANLTIHSLDPSGLSNVGPISRASSPLRGSAVAAATSRDIIENLQHQDELRVLPDRTGGRAVVNTNGPQEAVPAIFRESESYYLLAFRQTDDTAARHTVSVKVRRDGVSVHTRSGYAQAVLPTAAPQPPASAGLAAPTRAALTGLLPAADVPLDAQVAMFASPEPGRGALAIVAGVGPFLPAAGVSAPIEVVASAFDRTGRQRGLARQALEVSGPAEGRAAATRTEIISRLDVPPGDYQVRVAVTGGSPERSASVFADVTVPRFDAVPLSLSSVVLAATAGTQTAPRGFLEPLMPVLPTARREFARGDRVLAFLKVYQGLSRRDALRPVTLRTTVLDEQGRDVAAASAVMAPEAFAASRTGEHFITVPVAPLVAGEYLLRIEASAGEFSAGRALRFRMR
ncbi:MAG TPA: VWA domain-containing protein, partial [Vicinamibacterales bacterium]|nr:VWA domain-containing protein [Vicinamibacterales bacterium]